MSDTQPAAGLFEGLGFPLWVVVDEEAQKQAGGSLATHYLAGDDSGTDLPLFRTRARALAYIAARPLPGHRPAQLNDPRDLLPWLELFRDRGGTHVRIDDPDGRTPGVFCPALGTFIEYIRGRG